MDVVASIVGEEYRLTISGHAFVLRKDLFRDDLFKCNGTAGVGVTSAEIMASGQCGCLGLNLEEVGTYVSRKTFFFFKWDVLWSWMCDKCFDVRVFFFVLLF